MGDILFELKHVSGEDNKATPLFDINLKIERGQLYVILGMDYMELKSLLSLTSGRFFLKGGCVLINNKMIEIKKLVRYFQYIASDPLIYNSLSVFDNIFLMKSQLLSLCRKKILKQELQKIMNDTGVELNLEKKGSQLTKKEKRILSYYRAIIADPKLVLILDSNANANIDIDDKFKRLIEYMKHKGVGLIYLTSSSESALYFADEVALLRDGQLIGSLKGDDARKNPKYILRLFREWNMYTEDSIQQLSIEENWLKTVNLMTSRTELSSIVNFIAQGIASSVKAKECIIYIFHSNFTETLVVSDQDNPNMPLSPGLLKKFSEDGEKYIVRGDQDIQEILYDYKDDNKNIQQIYLNYSHNKQGTKIVIQLNFDNNRLLSGWETEYIDISREEVYHTVAHSKLLGSTDTLREVHHRIKNNLQLIIGLLEMQKYSYAPLTADTLDSIIKRVKSIALVQDMFAYKTSGAECGLVSLKNLMINLVQIYNGGQMDVLIDMIDLLVTYDTATSILMVINELLNNAWKYAFDKDHKGVVWIYAKEDIKTVYFTIEDNGKGMSEENKSSGIGYLIIDSIVKNDLKGKIHRNISRSGKGLSVTIDIPQTTFSPKK